MRKLIYSMQMSLDGYIEDSEGNFAFTRPEPDLHAYINDLESTIDTHIYGRRLYETMNGFWPTAGDDPEAPPEIVDYARIWNALDKVVYSRSLKSVEGRARFGNPDLEAEIAALKSLPGKDISVGGADIARQFIERGLVDEHWVIIYPVLIGGGKPMFGTFANLQNLALFDTRTFPSGVTVLRYRQQED